MTTTVNVRGEEHPSIGEAIQHLSCSAHDAVITIAGRIFSVTQEECDRLDMLRVVSAQWFWHEASDRLMSVPR